MDAARVSQWHAVAYISRVYSSHAAGITDLGGQTGPPRCPVNLTPVNPASAGERRRGPVVARRRSLVSSIAQLASSI